jgi:hypothetical protein
MELRPIEVGQVIYRQMRGLPVLFHARLKHHGRTLAVLTGKSQEEAEQRAQRLVDTLTLDPGSVTIEQA